MLGPEGTRLPGNQAEHLAERSPVRHQKWSSGHHAWLAQTEYQPLNPSAHTQSIFLSLANRNQPTDIPPLFLFRLPLAPYGVYGQGIRAEPQLRPKPQLQQHRTLNPLCWARDRTCILCSGDAGRPHCAPVGTPQTCFSNLKFKPRA